MHLCQDELTAIGVALGHGQCILCWLRAWIIVTWHHLRGHHDRTHT